MGLEFGYLLIGGGDDGDQLLHGRRDRLRGFRDAGHGALGILGGLYGLPVKAVEFVELRAVLILPLHEFAYRGVERLEVLAELFGQVLVEVHDHLLQGLDDLFGGRLRQLLPKVVKLAPQRLLEDGTVRPVFTPCVVEVGAHELQLAGEARFLGAGDSVPQVGEQLKHLGVAAHLPEDLFGAGFGNGGGFRRGEERRGR